MRNLGINKLMLTMAFVLISLVFKAQKHEEVIYFYVDNFTVEKCSEWIKSKNGKPTSVYVCIPAKIIGVKKAFLEAFKSDMSIMKMRVKKLELNKSEIEAKCANHRR